jgi:two-component system LytT family response regulator
MSNIRTVIVEDEEPGINNLVEKLKRNCPQVEVVDICRTAPEAMTNIPLHKPDLVFLDINLGSLNGFDVLNYFGTIDFEVVFTTDYDQYVINAIRVNALDYLLKPISEQELVEAVTRH